MNKTTYLVVSDIHGDFLGAQAVEESFRYHTPTYILCLGDVLYHGPRNDLPQDYNPKAVIPLMNAYASQIIAVRGNCDAEVDQMVLDFACMADYHVIPHNNHTLFLSHGHVYGPSQLPRLQENDIFLSGHTHVPTAYKKDGIFLLNPGSISLPKENHPRTYGLLEEHQFTIFTLDHKEYMRITF